jgi:hypothetical protein
MWKKFEDKKKRGPKDLEKLQSHAIRLEGLMEHGLRDTRMM